MTSLATEALPNNGSRYEFHPVEQNLNPELVDNFSNVHDTITLPTGKSCQDKIHCSSEASQLGKSGNDLSPPVLGIVPSSTMTVRQ